MKFNCPERKRGMCSCCGEYLEDLVVAEAGLGPGCRVSPAVLELERFCPVPEMRLVPAGRAYSNTGWGHVDFVRIVRFSGRDSHNPPTHMRRGSILHSV